MLKALLKKQFLELNQFYFTNRKTGKARSKGGAIGMIILFVICFLFIAGAFFGLAMVLGSSLFPAGLDWLYFAFFYMIAIVLGVFGSVFNTYNSLYLAKDNELLFSLPIPAGRILFVRMVGVFAMSLLYSAVAWIPAVICYWISVPQTVLTVLFPVILTFAATTFVTVLACILGWVVAKIAVKLKRKTITTVIISILIIVLYYVIYFRMNDIIRSVIANSGVISDTIRTWIYPVYQFGLAACGQVVPLLITLVIIGILFLITYLVLSRSFIRIATTNKGQNHIAYTEKTAAQRSISQALLRKECKRLLGSSTYMLNSCFGILVLVALTVLAVINRQMILDIASGYLNSIGLDGLLLPFMVTAICLVTSMNQIAAPSISLEGQTIWILQSLPVRPSQILHAKIMLHTLVNAVPALICTVVLGIIINASFYDILLMIAVVCVFQWFIGSLGLMMNLIKPNLTWKNEAAAVKQSISVFLALLIGWAVSLAVGALSLLTTLFISNTVYLFIVLVILGIGIFLVDLWMRGKGSRIFLTL